METYLPAAGPGKGQSCMDCHAFATPEETTVKNSTNQVFTFVLENADPPAIAAAKAGPRRSKLPQNVLATIHSRRNAK